MASIESDLSTSTSSEPTSAHPSVRPPSPTSASSVPTTDEQRHSDASASGSSDEDTSPRIHTHTRGGSSTSTNSSHHARQDPQHLQRPAMGSRKSSGTIVVPRDSPYIELEEEEYDEDDARTMSPRRSSQEVERMGEDARQALISQARQLQASLLEVVERVETVRSEHEKLEGGNRFLQSYIGELMQTSKITSTGAAKSKTKGKGRTGR